MVVGGYGVSCVRGRWENEKGEEGEKKKKKGLVTSHLCFRCVVSES
jgi:hypothetical protein